MEKCRITTYNICINFDKRVVLKPGFFQEERRGNRDLHPC